VEEVVQETARAGLAPEDRGPHAQAGAWNLPAILRGPNHRGDTALKEPDVRDGAREQPVAVTVSAHGKGHAGHVAITNRHI
jgi:hypothetical protein